MRPTLVRSSGSRQGKGLLSSPKSTRHKDQHARRWWLSSRSLLHRQRVRPAQQELLGRLLHSPDTSWSCLYGLAFLRCRDDSIEYQIFYGLSAAPIDCFRCHLCREDLIIASLVRVGRWVLLKRD